MKRIKISEQDKKSLYDVPNLRNQKFADMLMELFIKYDALTPSDVEKMCSKEKCREMFPGSSYTLLRLVPEGTKDLMAITHDRTLKPRYYNKFYRLFGQNYVFTNDLYGIGKSINERSNRNFIYKWALSKYGYTYEELSDEVNRMMTELWPSYEEYNPNMTKDSWVALLNSGINISVDEKGALAAFYSEVGSATCSFLGLKYEKTATSISSSITKLVKKIGKNKNIPIFKIDDTKQYWYILFQSFSVSKDGDLDTVWKLRSEVYDALTELDIMQDEWTSHTNIDPVIDLKNELAIIQAYVRSKGFNYNENLIENFYLSLKSKPFVILAGTSGTGKTRLVKLFAEAIGAGYKLVSVRPDWSDGSDLFGHYDLNGNFIEGPVCECFDIAIANPQKPVLICLDEMNLARVEYYLSDFLSVIESREKLVDGSIVTTGIAQYETGIPDNLYIVGTVNMDETTFPFSRKVLDRANTIEFNYVDLIPTFDSVDTEIEPLEMPNSFLRSEYLVLARDCVSEAEYVNEISTELQMINEILRKANAHVGYRVRDEIVFYMLESRKDGGILKYEEAMDNEIMQKILPRLQGSSISVKNMLCELFKLCAADHSQKTGDTDSEKMQKVLDDSGINCRYRKSAEKLQMMVRRFEEDGFTSYWL